MTFGRGPEDPGAKRRLAQHPGRDPRVLVGALLVLGSAVVGGAVFEARDDRVAFWAVQGPVVAGEPVSRADLTRSSARVDGAAARQLLAVGDELPGRLEALVWTRDLPAGSLVDRASLRAATARDAVELPLNVAAGSAPDGLAVGDRVDVWSGPGPGDPGGGTAVRVLEAVRVVSVGADDVLDGGLQRTVVVDAADQLDGRVVGALASGHVTVVRRS